MSNCLGELIRKHRLNAGISLRKLGNKVGVSRTYLCDIELGNSRIPSDNIIIKLSKSLGINRTELERLARITRLNMFIKTNKVTKEELLSLLNLV